jgi:PAS domain S-box-containing protein
MTFNLTSSDRKMVFKIILIYSLFGGLWIYLSDTILGWLVHDPEIITRIATYKGLFFIAITATLLYYLVGRYLSRISQSNRALQESDARFRTILETTTDGFYVNDTTGRFLEANAAYCRMVGYSRDELLNKSIADLEATEKPVDVAEHMARVMACGSDRFESRHKTRDGSLVDVEISLTYLPEQGGRVYSFARDITLRKQLEEQFRMASFTINSISDAVYWIDPDGCLLNVNDAACHMRGYSRDELLVMQVSDLDPNFPLVAWRPHWDELKLKGALQFETTHRSKDGTDIEVEVTANYLRFNDTEYNCAVVRSIHDRKESERALRESEENLRSLLALMPVGVACTTTDGAMEYLNPYFVESFGYTLEEIPTVEQWFLKAYPDRQYRESLQGIWVEQFERAKNSGIQIPPRAVTLTCKDGSIRDVMVNAQMSQNRLVAILTDITEQETRRNELIKNQKLESIGVLAGGIAHDFNNILTGILGNISFARMFVDADHKSAKPLFEAEKASKRAADLAQQLLTFTRGGQPLTKAVSLQHLLDESISLVLRGSNVISSIVIDDGLRALEADEGQISQVINNLILNAVQAMPRGGTITINAENMNLDGNNILSMSPGSYVRLQVSDQGCGIPQENLKNIFDPYFTTKSGGTGLGLASVHSIISKHGGYISVRSSQGRGTTFEILLPASAEQPMQTSLSDSAAHPSHRAEASILVMDDEEMICDLTSAILGDLGYRVTTCSNGQEAIDLYRAAFQAGVPFQAVIMDLTIPGGMGGKEAAQNILDIDPKACLIVSSGYSHDQIVADYRDFGFSGVAVKPYTANYIASVLSDLVPDSSERT